MELLITLLTIIALIFLAPYILAAFMLVVAGIIAVIASIRLALTRNNRPR
jgi:hypothetical protein